MAAKLKNGAAGLFSGLGRFFSAVEQRLWALLPGGLREKLPWLRGRLVLSLAGLTLLVILVLTALFTGRPVPEAPEREAAVIRAAPIPPEELFLPEEPDFLPPVILERERREAWTVDDAAPYWYNPLEHGEEEWRERVEKVIDDLLERAP
jgi:hypothetical protein